jgi:hypothetical protein
MGWDDQKYEREAVLNREIELQRLWVILWGEHFKKVGNLE